MVDHEQIHRIWCTWENRVRHFPVLTHPATLVQAFCTLSLDTQGLKKFLSELTAPNRAIFDALCCNICSRVGLVSVLSRFRKRPTTLWEPSELPAYTSTDSRLPSKAASGVSRPAQFSLEVNGIRVARIAPAFTFLCFQEFSPSSRRWSAPSLDVRAHVSPCSLYRFRCGNDEWTHATANILDFQHAAVAPMWYSKSLKLNS